MKEIPQERTGLNSELRIEHPEAAASTARSPPVAGVALARWRRLLYRRDFALSSRVARVRTMLAPRAVLLQVSQVRRFSFVSSLLSYGTLSFS